DGQTIYPQHPLADMTPLRGQRHSGVFEGKMIRIQHTHDSSLWPVGVILHRDGVLAAMGKERTAERFCLRWTDNAEHVPPSRLPNSPGRAANTWLIDYQPVI